MKFKHTLVGLLLVFVVSMFLPLVAHADDSVVPKGTPSNPPFNGLFIQWSGGFTQQPADINTISNTAYAMTINAVPSSLDPKWSTTVHWYVSTNGHDWNDAGQGSGQTPATFTDTKKVSQVTTLYYQASVVYAGFLGLRPTTYWSKVAKVIISPNEVHASNINLLADSDTLPNGTTTNMHAVLTPTNATDKISWSVSDSSLATIASNSGTLSASTDAKKYGKVVVTAKTANGLSASMPIYVGALQDLASPEDQEASFTVKGFPKDTTVTEWHQVTPDGKDTTLTGNANTTITTGTDGTPNAVLTIKKAGMSFNGNKYYATVKLSNITQTIQTNQAQLTVVPGEQLTLSAVPDFAFTKSKTVQSEPITVNDLRRGLTLMTNPTKSVGKNNNFDGNDHASLIVYDPRVKSDGWTLFAALSPFINTTTQQSLGMLGSNKLALIDDHNKTMTTIPDNNEKTVVTNAKTNKSNLAATLSNSTLNIEPTTKGSPGTYNATISWTLANVPSPASAK